MALDITKFYTVTQKDVETDLDAVLAKAANGFSPILIKGDNGFDMLLLDWNDYFERFSILYTKEELEEIGAVYNRAVKPHEHQNLDANATSRSNAICVGCKNFNPYGDCIVTKRCPECGAELVCMCRNDVYSSFAKKEERLLHCRKCLSDWRYTVGSGKLERKLWG